MKRSEVIREQAVVRKMLQEAAIPLRPDAEIEIADFGLGRYRELGLGLVVRINEPEYCSKWLTLLPGQTCPWHHHKLKKETFFIHKGEVILWAGDKKRVLKEGEHYTLERGVEHQFTSEKGAIVEEVSTHDENSDSYFRDPNIVREPVIEED